MSLSTLLWLYYAILCKHYFENKKQNQSRLKNCTFINKKDYWDLNLKKNLNLFKIKEKKSEILT